MGKGASVLEYSFLEWGSYPSDWPLLPVTVCVLTLGSSIRR